MRALLDTNVLVSVLLAFVLSSQTMEQLFDAAIRGRYVLLLPEEVLAEMEGAWARKSFLRDSISAEQLSRFLALLRSIAEIVPRQADPIAAVLRDPRDDFLLVAAVFGNADFLVTGDRDLLDIRDELEGLRIVTPAEFLDLLSTSAL